VVVSGSPALASRQQPGDSQLQNDQEFSHKLAPEDNTHKVHQLGTWVMVSRSPSLMPMQHPYHSNQQDNKKSNC
jgi:hypothetical protein